jgi:hypothetical protein
VGALDRLVATSEWLALFPQARVFHLDYTGSDHKPLWLSPESNHNIRAAKPFRFEEMWMSDVGCAETIANSWKASSSGNHMFRVISKLNHCRKNLKLGANLTLAAFVSNSKTNGVS